MYRMHRPTFDFYVGIHFQDLMTVELQTLLVYMATLPVQTIHQHILTGLIAFTSYKPRIS